MVDKTNIETWSQAYARKFKIGLCSIPLIIGLFACLINPWIIVPFAALTYIFYRVVKAA